jgi:ComF family protein
LHLSNSFYRNIYFYVTGDSKSIELRLRRSFHHSGQHWASENKYKQHRTERMAELNKEHNDLSTPPRRTGAPPTGGQRAGAALKESILHYLFPHVCEGCGTDVLATEHFLCLKCLADLPKTEFQFYPNNPVEKIFWGRLPIASATAYCYFTKGSTMQHLMHQLKYKGNKEIGVYLGRLMGHALADANRFRYVDALVPLPLFSAKEKKRGYNQAAALCEGMAEAMNKPVWKDVVVRTVHTESQTKKNRTERWQNMEGRFELVKPEKIEGAHVLLVDDVVTTGATLESCGLALLQAQGTRLSLATLCISSR